MDSGQQKRLLKEKIRGSVRKTERIRFTSTATQAGRDFAMGAYFGHAGQEQEMDPEG